jgi:CO/xanthine dehydrogenase Mo-binding subunit
MVAPYARTKLPAERAGTAIFIPVTNPLGMRGGSEGGITPGLAAVTNAIVDALAEFGIEHIELPATPERVWRAIGGARRQP